MKPVTFTYHTPQGDRRHFVTAADIRVVLERIPIRFRKGLKAVHFNDRPMGVRRIGYVRRGRDEVALCALPPRVSLTRFKRQGQSPTQFGAIRGSQWPGLAVRRFLLYDVFLRELGRIQGVDAKEVATRRRSANEVSAQDFAEHWRRELWSQPFDHSDPVHGPPSPQEIETLRKGWTLAHSDFKASLLCEKAKRYEDAVPLLKRAVERCPTHAMALERLGVLSYAGQGTPRSNARAIELLGAAIRLDSTLFDGHLFLGLALAHEGREAEARHSFERAVSLDPHPPIAMAAYADTLADWGAFSEAEAWFQRALRRHRDCVFAIRDYGRCLLRDHNPEAEHNIGRAIALFEHAVALDPSDAESHYRLGDALLCVDGEEDQAIGHLERALSINAKHEKAADRLAAIGAGPSTVDTSAR